MKLRWLTCLLPAFLVSGCTNTTPEAYLGERPEFVLERYFNGTVDGWGMVQDRSGKVLRRFVVRIDANWQGNTGTLDEAFDWSDGTKERRIWIIEKTAERRYLGRAADIVGTATGVAGGNALQWQYVLKLPADQGGYEVDLDDWMYLIDEDTMLNRSVITKFGIRFAEVTITFRKRGR